APLLFLWIEATVIRFLGTSELALRLPLFLAGLASLALFWRLARLTLGPLGHTLAVGILAVSIWPVTTGMLVKPYAFDLLGALVLLVLTMQWLAQPERLCRLALLVGALPFIILMSYASVFIASTVSVLLLPTVWRQRGWRTRALYVGYNAVLVITF